MSKLNVRLSYLDFLSVIKSTRYDATQKNVTVLGKQFGLLHETHQNRTKRRTCVKSPFKIYYDRRSYGLLHGGRKYE